MSNSILPHPGQTHLERVSIGGGRALPPRDSLAIRKASLLIPALTPPNPHAKLAGAFVKRVRNRREQFLSCSCAMHESAMRVHPSSCPFDKEVRRVGFPNAFALLPHHSFQPFAAVCSAGATQRRPKNKWARTCRLSPGHGKPNPLEICVFYTIL